MKTGDLIKLAITGLKRRTARTFLTVLGVIIGTVCIVLMIAVGLSSYRQFEEGMLGNRNLTEITVNNYSESGTGVGITDSTVTSLQSLAHVETVSPVIELPVYIRAGKYEASLHLTAIDPAALDLDFAEGGMFDKDSGIPSIVLGGERVMDFIDPRNPPNYNDYQAMMAYRPDIDLLTTEMEMVPGYGNETEDPDAPAPQRYRARISGITAKSFSESSYHAYIDIDAAKRIVMENRELAERFGIRLGSYNTVKIMADDIENVEDVLAEVRKLGYETYSPVENIRQVREEQARQQGQLFAIGFISLLVSAIGIANTMYANILERRRDIGVMKVVGMKIRKIRGLFILESAIIGLMGGLVGLGVSYIVVLLINTGTEQTSFLGMYFHEGMKVSIPPWLALGALLIAVAVGVLSGIYPAGKATKMSPLEAMRN